MNKRILMLALTGLVILASCGKKSAEERIADIENSIRKQESTIRKAEGKISDMREEIAVLGGDTIQAPEIVYITTMNVSRKDFEGFVEIPATVESKDDVMLSSDLGGTVIRLNVDEGENVSVGQVIAELDGQLVRSNIAEVEQSLSLARTVFEKRERLWNQNIGSEIEFLQAKNNVESLEKTIATLNTQLSKLTVRTPISGVVDAVMVESGEMAGPGSPIVRVVNLRRVQVKAEVPEIYVGKIQKGDKVSVEFGALGKEIEARVSMVGQTINANNRTFSVEVDLPNADRLLKPNLVGTIRIRDQFIADQVIVPSRLVQNSYDGDFVYKVDTEKNIAVRQWIETGKTSGAEIVVSKGLTGDEVLVDKGFRNVSDSSQVVIADLQAN